MESALGGIAIPVDESDRDEQTAGDGQIVIVRPQVVDNVGHVLGNLFQRIYHLIDQAREIDSVVAEQLDGSTRQLDDFLQLVMDYFSPLPLALEYVSGAEIAQSLGRQISDAIGRSVRIEAKLPIEGRLLVDPGRLARSFGLLAMQLRQSPGNNDGAVLKAVAQSPGRWLMLSVQIASRFVSPRSSESEMRWAVAEKFLEMHGGSLEQKSTPAGDALWEIVLPLQP